jgi:hypothetical protein
MPSYRTLAQILIATSAVGSALAAPAPAQEMHDARADLSQLDRRISPDLKSIGATAPLAGLVAGVMTTVVYFVNKYITADIGHK